MKKNIFSFLLVFTVVLSCFSAVSAEGKITSNKFTLVVYVVQP